jgi:CheY-like chemotaxis protein
MTRILLVEDDAAVRLLLTDFLMARGYQVESASNGAEALARLREQRPDAMVMDLQMPIVDGWTLLRTLRSKVEFSDVRVVVMSAVEGADDSIANLGVHRCLRKPFDVEQLAGALDRLELSDANAVRACSTCGTDATVHRLRVFELKNPDGYWYLCDQCWSLLEIGFDAHRPNEDLETWLRGPISINAVEARGWIQTGLRQAARWW